MPKFRKRAIVIEAEQFSFRPEMPLPKGVVLKTSTGANYPGNEPVVETLEGDMKITEGDWIITGVNGDQYPCKPDIFEKTYEPVTDPGGKDGMMEKFDFSEALRMVKAGKKVARVGWNGPDQSVYKVVPDAGGAITKPYMAITTSQGDRIPWLASQGDLFAEDWYEVSA